MNGSFIHLLVHLDATARGTVRLNVARSVARGQGAAITALYAVTPALLELPYTPEAGPNVVSALREIDEQRRATARGGYDRAQAEPGPHIGWAEVSDYPIVAAFTRQALYADLLVLGQHDPSERMPACVPPDFAQSVIAASGKPALVLPYEHSRASVGDIVAIGWKPTREAARAVAAAVPLLRRARKVHVLAWGSEEEEVQGERLDLDSYLKLRGIEPVWHREGGPEPGFVGELLLSRAFDLDADLLVMGCYGHSRAREWVLGGTSRTILRSMTLPVLMSH